MSRIGRSRPVSNYRWLPKLNAVSTSQTKLGSDVGAGSDTAIVIAQVPAADAGTGGDSSPNIAIPGQDTGSGADTYTAVRPNASDTGTGADLSGGVVAQVPAAETAAGADSGVVNPGLIPAADTGATADSGATTLTRTGADTGSFADTGRGALQLGVVNDTGSGTENATALIDAIGTGDAGVFNDTANVYAQVADTDFASWSESTGTAIPGHGIDVGAFVEGASRATPDYGSFVDFATVSHTVADIKVQADVRRARDRELQMATPYIRLWTASPCLAPPAVTLVVHTTGGSLAANNKYHWAVTALNDNGETDAIQVAQKITGSTSSVTLSWPAVSGATGYKVYRAIGQGLLGTGFFENSKLIATLSAATLTYTDTGTAGSSQAVPRGNTASIMNPVGLYLRGVVTDSAAAKFTWKKNVAAQGTMTLKPDSYLAEWLMSIPDDDALRKNVVISVDYAGGMRWSGLLKSWNLKTDKGFTWLETTWIDDLQYLQFLLGPPNPVLPIPVFQFPRVCPLWGPDIWAVSLMIWLNIARKEGSFLHMPDDPFDLAGWFPDAPPTSQWQAHIKAPSWNAFADPEISWRPWALCATRMNRIDQVIADALDDGQLTLTYRRVFTEDGESAIDNLGYEVCNGALVFEVVDNSGLMRPDGNMFTGNIFQGYLRGIAMFAANWLDDYRVFASGDNETLYPDEYYQPGYRGQKPGFPNVFMRDNKWSPLVSTQLTWSPATASSVVVGGDNQMVDQLIDAMFASMSSAGSGGDLAQAIIEPLIVGTIFSWLEWTNVARKDNLGWAHLWEIYQTGAENNAWSLSAIIALREGFESTRSVTAHQFVMEGPQAAVPGLDFTIGNRIGSTYEPWRKEIFVNHVEEMSVSWDWPSNKAPSFSAVVGENKALMTQAERIARATQKALETLKDLGVHLIS